MTTIFCHYESSKLNFPTLVTGMQSKNKPFVSERLRREASLFVRETQEANISPDLVTEMSRSVTLSR